MSQNRSSAVMNQRIEPDDSLDDFPTPMWGTRALIEMILRPTWYGGRPPFKGTETAWEPCCNRGFMARPLREYFGDRLYSTDVYDYGWTGMDETADFLWPGTKFRGDGGGRPDWIFANPPFRLAEEFIVKANKVARVGFAVLVRTSFLEGVGRYERLFRDLPPSIVAQFTERLPMVKGRCDVKVTTATSYCWLVWIDDWIVQQRMMWIPPCRKALERPGDYDIA